MGHGNGVNVTYTLTLYIRIKRLLRNEISAFKTYGTEKLETNRNNHGRRHRGAEWGRGLPWIFILGTNTVDRGLKVIFFAVFYYFSVFFRCPLPPGKFSADALGNNNKKLFFIYLFLFCTCKIQKR